MPIKRDIIIPTDEEDREITQAAESDADNPPLSNEQLAALRPAEKIVPEVVKAHRRGGIKRRRGPQKAPTKKRITIRLSPEVVEHFRATGKGWQSRVDEALREYIREHG